MIYNAQQSDYYRDLTRLVLPALFAAHRDLTNIAAWLRDGDNVDVWTENPSDDSRKTPGKESFSLEGWRVHFGRQRSLLAAFNATNGATLQSRDAAVKTALDGFLASVPAIGTVFNTIVGNYEDGSGRLIQTMVSQADRDVLATAIEAELQ